MRVLPIFIVLILFASCRKNEHRLKFENQFNAQVLHLTVGPLHFHDVQPGGITGYENITEGTHAVSGETSLGTISATCTINGKGKNDWTMKLDPNGNVLLTKEK